MWDSRWLLADWKCGRPGSPSNRWRWTPRCSSSARCSEWVNLVVLKMDSFYFNQFFFENLNLPVIKVSIKKAEKSLLLCTNFVKMWSCSLSESPPRDSHAWARRPRPSGASSCRPSCQAPSRCCPPSTSSFPTACGSLWCPHLKEQFFIGNLMELQKTL